MPVVDFSVWIDFFSGDDAPAAELLGHLLDHGEVRIVVPDLVLFEVLRGFRHERDLRTARHYALLHEHRDFDAFESLRGLRVWRH